MQWTAFIFLLFILSSCSHNEYGTSSDQILIAIEDAPSSFDPRLIRNTCSVNIAHLINEGLMRFDDQGKLTLALAEQVDVDASGTVYTFLLKKAEWSNGDPITAFDFENTIKSVLSPKVPSPHANQLYVIKGAQSAKSGDSNEIGVKALDDKTLVIELHEPAPYFLTLTATHFLYPVHKNDLELNQNTIPIASGPFMVDSYNPASEIVLKKNERFWDAPNVRIKEIKLLPLNDQIALQLFEGGEIDWAGSPIGTLPPDAIAKITEKGALKTLDSLGTFWLRVNTLDETLASKEVRRALSNSIDRSEIVTHITQAGQKPAFTIVPPILYGETVIPETKGSSYQQVQTSGPISLIYMYNERSHKIAQYLEQVWKKKLGIQLVLEAQESGSYYDRIANKRYQLSLGSWFADIPDAVNFLDIFKNKETKTNGTGWENKDYAEFLEAARKEPDALRRIALLKKSEKILMDDTPVIPLFFGVFAWVQNPNLKGVIVSPLGFFDFRHATKETR